MGKYGSLYNSLVINKKELRLSNLFWVGFIIYTLAYAFSSTTLVNYIVCQLFQICGIVIFIATAVPLIQFKFDNSYLKFIIISYFLWNLGIILRGITFDYDELKDMLFDAWFGVFIYLAPLVVLFPKNIVSFKRLFNVILVLSFCYIVYDIIFIKYLLNRDLTNLTSQGIVENLTKTLGIPCGFLLLTYKYHSKRVNLLAIFVTVLAIFFALVRARRGLILITASPLIFTYILFLLKSKRKGLLIYLSLILSGLILIYGLAVFNSQIFNSVKERGVEDTRSGVERSFYNDMKTTDWIVGKGMDGKYFAPGIDPGLSPYRNTIETDYLQIILKGGLISLILLLLITVPAAIMGIFYSKNLLSQAAGVWILIWILSLYPANVNTFTMTYLLVWLSVGICYSKTLRNIPDRVMEHYLTHRIDY